MNFIPLQRQINNHIKTRNDKNFWCFGLKAILNNPVYAATDEDTLKYFTDLETVIYNNFSEFFLNALNYECGFVGLQKELNKSIDDI